MRFKKSLFLGSGDVDAFFGLVVDNMTQLVVMAAILINVFDFPKELVYLKIIPDSATPWVRPFLSDSAVFWVISV